MTYEQLSYEWIGHALSEEFHQRMARSNGPLNDGTSGYHREMQGWHKCQRLALEKTMRAMPH